MIIKKRSPKDIIEKEKSHKVEHVYVKFPGQNLIEITLDSKEINVPEGKVLSVKEDIYKLKTLWETYKRQYTHVHTHTYSPNDPLVKDRKFNHSPLPSEPDMNRFLGDDDIKNMAIAQINRDTHKLEGYFYLMKSKDTRPTGYSPLIKDEFMANIHNLGIIKGIGRIIEIALKQRRIRKDTRKYGKEVIISQKNDTPENLFPLIRRLSANYNLQYRFVPAEGYEISKDKTKFIPKNLESRLTAITTIIILLSSVLLIDLNFTGKVISNLNQTFLNLLGIILFLVGLAGTWVYLKNKK